MSDTDRAATESANSPSPLEDTGKLLLRVAVAGLMLFHGVAKLTGGVAGIEGMLNDASLPTWLAYGVFVGEIVAPLLMLVGVFTRSAAVVFAGNMVVAIILGHSGELLSLNQYGGWAIELPVLYLVGAVVVALIGPGRVAIKP